MTTKPKPGNKTKFPESASGPRQPSPPRPKAKPQKASQPKSLRPKPGQPEPEANSSAAKNTNPRAPSKTATLLALLTTPGGITAQNLSTALGWQAHTVRAALSGLRKSGKSIERVEGTDGQGSRYRLVPSPVPASAVTAAAES